jgi:hypothetical protein
MQYLGSCVKSTNELGASQQASTTQRRCKHCGSSEHLERRPARHPHFAALWCFACDRHIMFLSKPRDLDSSLAFVMPCRPCQGSKMSDLSVSCLDWLRMNLGGNIARHATIVLESLPLDRRRWASESRTANSLLSEKGAGQ